MLRKNIPKDTPVFHIDYGHGIFKHWSDDKNELAVVFFSENQDSIYPYKLLSRKSLTELES